MPKKGAESTIRMRVLQVLFFFIFLRVDDKAKQKEREYWIKVS